MKAVKAAVIAVMLALVGCEHQDPDPVPNVRLGMTPRDVRDRFQPGAQGAWATSLGVGDDTLLDWTSKDPQTGTFRRARFEFHNGMLVAIRAQAQAPEGDESITSTTKTVTIRRPAEGGTSLVVLSRDCPTHKDEAESLAARSTRRSR